MYTRDLKELKFRLIGENVFGETVVEERRVLATIVFGRWAARRGAKTYLTKTLGWKHCLELWNGDDEKLVDITEAEEKAGEHEGAIVVDWSAIFNEWRLMQGEKACGEFVTF